MPEGALTHQIPMIRFVNDAVERRVLPICRPRQVVPGVAVGQYIATTSTNLSHVCQSIAGPIPICRRTSNASPPPNLSPH